MPTDTKTSLRRESWEQWMERCQFSLCDESKQEWLEEFVAKRSFSKLKKVNGGEEFWVSNFRQQEGRPPIQQSQLFENWLLFEKIEVSKIKVKRYLASRTKGSVPYLEALVTDLIRDFLLTYLNKEKERSTKGIHFVPAQAVRGSPNSFGEGFTLEDLLRSEEVEPDQDAELNELDQIAENLANFLYRDFTADERLFLFAFAQGLPRSDQRILQQASVEKTQFSELGRSSIAPKITKEILRQFGKDVEKDSRILNLLRARVSEKLMNLANSSGNGDI
jgi:hypothetical protein